MRLGQLTRQLEVETSQIIKFLSGKGIEIEDHPNTKIADDVLETLYEAFKSPISITEIVSDVVKEIEIVEPLIVASSELVAEEIIAEKTEVIEKIEEVTIDVPQEKINIEVEPIAEQLQMVEAESIISLPQEEIQKLVESGEIQSEIEAEALGLDGNGIIKAKFQKLEGLSVKGKIELPIDSKREKKEQVRKEKEEHLKVVKNAGKTIDGVHPSKRAKDEGEKIKEELQKAEEAAKIRAEKQKKKAEQEALKQTQQDKKRKKTKALKSKVLEKQPTAEELRKKNNRDKRQRQKEKERETPVKKSFWQRLFSFLD